MKNRHRGVAAVELALILPLLLAIGFAITEFGRGIYTYNTLTKSARGASRYLSTQLAGDTAAYATARNLVAYGNPAGTGAPLVPGLDSTNMSTIVNICDASIVACQATNLNQGTYPTINTVTVTITGYKFTPVIDQLGLFRLFTTVNGKVTFDDISVTMRQN